ncbi:MAG TPA: hypothetical protein VFD36_26350 [Kofleriaceae bacterium]|nr:hypothetical protein [Kofleriaceae bacterium]
MSFDGQTASTLDVVDVAFATPRRPAHRAPLPAMVASTVEGELVAEGREQASDSTIEPMLASARAFVVESDLAEFRSWLKRTGAAAVLDVVARAFARHMSTTGLKVVLETESEDPSAQRALIIAPVNPQQHDALERLFSFTSSPWWLSVVRGTRNAIVVDIQPG